KGANRACSAACHNTLKNGLQLIETRAVGSGDLGDRRLVGKFIDSAAIQLDRIDGVRLWSRAFVGDGGIEDRKIDPPHWLRAEPERIVANAVAVDFCRYRGGATLVEALCGVRVNPAVKQMRGD